MIHTSMNSQNNSSYLEIILGGMYAGKTSRLVEIYKQCVFCNITVAVINHSIDIRYDDLDNEFLSTHDQIKIPCIKTNLLFDTMAHGHDNIFNSKLSILSRQVILINEGQFFPDLEEFVKLLLTATLARAVVMSTNHRWRVESAAVGAVGAVGTVPIHAAIAGASAPSLLMVSPERISIKSARMEGPSIVLLVNTT